MSAIPGHSRTDKSNSDYSAIAKIFCKKYAHMRPYIQDVNVKDFWEKYVHSTIHTALCSSK